MQQYTLDKLKDKTLPKLKVCVHKVIYGCGQFVLSDGAELGTTPLC